MQALKRIVAKLLRETADKIDAGTCELSEQEALDIMLIFNYLHLYMHFAYFAHTQHTK